MGQEKECRKPTHRKHLSLHDYRERCIYHITLVVSDRIPLFGTMAGDTVDEARVELSPLGRMVRQAIQDIPVHEWKKGKDVQILAAVTMPEHIHFVLFVRQPMKEKLGIVIRGFKQGCNKALRLWMKNAGLMGAAPGVEGDGGSGDGGCGVDGCGLDDCGLEKSLIPNGEANDGRSSEANGGRSSEANGGRNGDGNMAGSGGMTGDGNMAGGGGKGVSSPLVTRGNSCSHDDTSEGIALDADGEAFVRMLRALRSERILQEHALFEADYDETRLRRKGQLSAMIRYVHNNPAHRWMKQHKPQWLKPMRGIMISGRSYDAIGNINLLGLPRWQVFVRSRWTDEQRRDYKNNCVIKARNGYALVSPFISPHEAQVRDFCLKEGHSVIVLSDNGFTDFTQCSGGLYDYCVNGQVLVLVASNIPHIERKAAISRKECMQLNSMAEEICAEGVNE